MDIEYRRAHSGDADGIYFVEAHCFAVPWSYDSIQQDVCANPDALYVTALERGHVIGFTGMHVVCDEGHIMNMAVLEEYRGQGVGRRLMEEVLSAAPEKVRSYTLEVRRSNEAAIRLYRRMGFYAVGVRRGYYTQPPEDALIMWRTTRALGSDAQDAQNTP
jgi:ribosomal-protein-alanine N-acetyltransferase